MKLRNRIAFFDTDTKEIIVSVAIYTDDYWYKILTESKANITGKMRMRESDALEYYNNEVAGIRKSLIERQIIFTSHES